MRSLPLEKWNTVIRWFELPGQGTPIVCLPGISFGAAPNFLEVMTQEPFRQRRVLMIDYIGSGASGHSETFDYSLDAHCEAIAQVLLSEATGPACIIGHSMGGSIAIALALAHPDLVSKLIVCEGNLTPGGGEASRAIAMDTPENFAAKGYDERHAKLLSPAMKGSKFANFLLGARSGADPRGLHGNAMALVNLPSDFQERFFALEVEKHFVWGEKTFPANTGQITPDAPDPDLLAQNNVGIHVIPGVGHTMMGEDAVATGKVFAQLV